MLMSPGPLYLDTSPAYSPGATTTSACTVLSGTKTPLTVAMSRPPNPFALPPKTAILPSWFSQLLLNCWLVAALKLSLKVRLGLLRLRLSALKAAMVAPPAARIPTVPPVSSESLANATRLLFRNNFRELPTSSKRRVPLLLPTFWPNNSVQLPFRLRHIWAWLPPPVATSPPQYMLASPGPL